MRICSVEGCGRRHIAKGYCSGHYQRWKYGADIHTPVRDYRFYDGTCAAKGCENPSRRSGYCVVHVSRLIRTGDACEDVPIRVPSIHDAVGERAVHERCKRLWGSAIRYTCVKCEGPANDWAYDGTDPDQLYGPTSTSSKVFYSRYPEFYMPMCKQCHSSRDRAASSCELREYRTLKQDTGLSCQEIRTIVERALTH